jgi:hypothetical protein
MVSEVKLYRIKNSDIIVNKNVLVAASAWYCTLPGRAKQARRMVKLVINALPIFRKFLKLPNNIVIRVCPIKSKNKQGQYVSEEKLVEIEYRNRKDYSFISTLAHELIHAEQYHTGKLSYSYKKRLHQWEGKDVNNKGTTYFRYVNQPWERQAFDCQEAFAVVVCDKLNIDHGFK